MLRLAVMLPPSLGQMFMRKYWTTMRLVYAGALLIILALSAFYYNHVIVNGYCLDSYGILGVPAEVALTPMTPQTATVINQMLFDFHSVMQEVGLFYVLAGPSLLGAVRHRGLIPWDTTTHVMAHLTDVEALEAALNSGLKPAGYAVRRTAIGFRIRPGAVALAAGNFPADLALSIFLMNFEGEEWRYDSNALQKANKRCTFKKEELEPRRLYKFAEFELFGPGDSESFIKRCFGPGALTSLTKSFQVDEARQCRWPDATFEFLTELRGHAKASTGVARRLWKISKIPKKQTTIKTEEIRAPQTPADKKKSKFQQLFDQHRKEDEEGKFHKNHGK